MSEKPENPQAFPSGKDDYWREQGMTLRDYFAGKIAGALATGCSGMLSGEFSAYAKGDCNAVIAERSYSLADAMLKAREASHD